MTAHDQELIALEREGARAGRLYVDAMSQFLETLRPYLAQRTHDESPWTDDNVAKLGAVLSGYLGVLFDDMPGVDMETAVRSMMEQFVVHAPIPFREKVAEAIVEKLRVRAALAGATLTTTGHRP